MTTKSYFETFQKCPGPVHFPVLPPQEKLPSKSPALLGLTNKDYLVEYMIPAF